MLNFVWQSLLFWVLSWCQLSWQLILKQPHQLKLQLHHLQVQNQTQRQQLKNQVQPPQHHPSVHHKKKTNQILSRTHSVAKTFTCVTEAERPKCTVQEFFCSTRNWKPATGLVMWIVPFHHNFKFVFENWNWCEIVKIVKIDIWNWNKSFKCETVFWISCR